MQCDNHPDRPAAQTGVIGGKFGHYCRQCVIDATRAATANSAAWLRDRDREDHREDMIQPKDPKTGKINPEFVRSYPEQSAEMFTQEDMQQALRQT